MAKWDTRTSIKACCVLAIALREFTIRALRGSDFLRGAGNLEIYRKYWEISRTKQIQPAGCQFAIPSLTNSHTEGP